MIDYLLGADVKKASVCRYQFSQDSNGHASEGSYQTIIHLHDVEIQRVSHPLAIENNQIKYEVTHRIYPRQWDHGAVQEGDFFIEGNNRYKISGIQSFNGYGYFHTVYNDSGKKVASSASTSFVVIENLSQGIYQFGSGDLAEVPAGAGHYEIILQNADDGSIFMTSETGSGFQLVNMEFGSSAHVNAYFWIYDKPSRSKRYQAKNLTPGTYLFGKSKLSRIPAIFTEQPAIAVQGRNDGSFYFQNGSKNGFEIVDRGIGSAPFVSIYAWKPQVGEFVVHGLTGGSYQFGSGALSSIPNNLTRKPIIVPVNFSDQELYIENADENGFDLVDRGTGADPLNTSITVITLE